MIRALCVCVLFLASASMSNAGFVSIDAMLPGAYPTSPSFINASGVGINNVTRTLTATGGFGFSASGQANFALKDSETGTLTYTFSSPLSLADFSVPTNENSMMQLKVTTNDLSAFNIMGYVNNTAFGPLTGSGGFISANFLNAVSGDINSLSFVFTHSGSSFDTISINAVSAVPEPTSMLSSGAFSLLCGWVYRRRKAKKKEALTV